MRKRTTIIGLYISSFVLLLSLGLSIYTFFNREVVFDKGLLGLLLISILLFWINWLNYMKLKKEEQSKQNKL